MEYNYPDKNDLITSKLIKKSSAYEKYWNKSEHRLLKYISRNIRSNGSFLDVGCGFGRLLTEFQPYFTNIVGIEPDINRYKKALENIDNELLNKNKVEILNTNIEDMECDKKFDLILCSHVIQHIETEKAKRVVCKMGEMLSENGILVILTSHSTTGHEYYSEAFIKDNIIHENKISEYSFNKLVTEQGTLPIRFLNLDSIKALIKKTNLKLDDYQVYHLENTSFVVLDQIVNCFPRLKKKHGRDFLVLLSKKQLENADE